MAIHTEGSHILRDGETALRLRFDVVSVEILGLRPTTYLALLSLELVEVRGAVLSAFITIEPVANIRFKIIVASATGSGVGFV